jgi:nucleotide-binding universal stress UspA family protein
MMMSTQRATPDDVEDHMTERGERPVVTGIDGTDEAQCAADFAAWAASRRRTALRLVYARGPTPIMGPVTPALDEYFWEQEWVRTLLAKTTAETKDAHPDLDVEAIAVRGRPAGVLVDESVRSGLVVVGTRAAKSATAVMKPSMWAPDARNERRSPSWIW